MKKIVAGASAITLIAMNLANLTVNAAGLNNIDSVTVTGNTVADTLTITDVGSFGGVTSATATIKNLDGTAAGTTTLTYNTSTANTLVFDIDTADLTINKAYIVSFVTNDNLYASVIVNVGTPNNNIVTVSATVLPTLSMSLDTTTLNLGNLDTVTYADQTVTVTTTTNAVGGADITMGSTGLKDANINREIGVTDIAGGVPQTGDINDRYLYTVGGAITGASTNMTASQVVLNGTTIADSNAATAVHIGAIVGATTEAGNYSDTLTFSVTGSF